MEHYRVSQIQNLDIYSMMLSEIDTDQVLNSINNTLTKFPRYKEQENLDLIKEYPTHKNVAEHPDIMYFSNSSAKIPGFHTQHSQKINPDLHGNLLDPEDFDVFKNLNAAIESKIYDLCYNTARHLVEFANIRACVTQFWCAKYRGGDKAEWHSHYGHCFNCVYYAEVENDTPIIIRNITNENKSFFHSHQSVNGIIENNLEITPKKGMLLIFPGETLHMVPPLDDSRGRTIYTASLNWQGI